jgi:hypothetical protein
LPLMVARFTNLITGAGLFARLHLRGAAGLLAMRVGLRYQRRAASFSP